MAEKKIWVQLVGKNKIRIAHSQDDYVSDLKQKIKAVGYPVALQSVDFSELKLSLNNQELKDETKIEALNLQEDTIIIVEAPPTSDQKDIVVATNVLKSYLGTKKRKREENEVHAQDELIVGSWNCNSLGTFVVADIEFACNVILMFDLLVILEAPKKENFEKSLLKQELEKLTTKYQTVILDTGNNHCMFLYREGIEYVGKILTNFAKDYKALNFMFPHTNQSDQRQYVSRTPQTLQFKISSWNFLFTGVHFSTKGNSATYSDILRLSKIHYQFQLDNMNTISHIIAGDFNFSCPTDPGIENKSVALPALDKLFWTPNQPYLVVISTKLQTLALTKRHDDNILLSPDLRSNLLDWKVETGVMDIFFESLNIVVKDFESSEPSNFETIRIDLVQRMYEHYPVLCKLKTQDSKKKK